MHTIHQLPIDPMTQDEAQFFRQLGARVAQGRKDHGQPQAQLGELPGISQQLVASFEVGRRRVPVSVLPTMARDLAVSMEDLIDAPIEPGKHGPAPKLQHQIERITRLPKAQHRSVMQMVDTVLQQDAGR